MSVSDVNADSFGDEIEVLCDRFEAQWKAGHRPVIDEFLSKVAVPARQELARELLKLDIHYRLNRGDTFMPDDYKPRFPEHASLIDQLLVPSLLPEPTTEPTHAGRYLLEGRIGGGGMGDVYRAHDPDFRRPLAVEILKQKFVDRPDMAGRFLREAKITGQLQHPGVPPVHEFGRLPDHRPFLAMKLIEGHTLADLLAERKGQSDGLPRFLVIFEQVCQTVAYAHSREVIHRDLKPRNVMVGAFGEVQVMDWGLAHAGATADRMSVCSDTANKTASSPLIFDTVVDSGKFCKVVGTLQYMSPEQAQGVASQRSDVFSLGATLCEILTGEPPYREASAEKLWQLATMADLADAFGRLDTCRVDAELISLAKRCLERRDWLRPADASFVAKAVTGYLDEVRVRLR